MSVLIRRARSTRLIVIAVLLVAAAGIFASVALHAGGRFASRSDTPDPDTGQDGALPSMVPPQPQVDEGATRRGLPAPGQAYLGVSSEMAIADFERAVGTGVALHRSYFGPGPAEVDQAVALARDDLASGRLPWLSFKLPASWADMASGAGDKWAEDLADQLGGLNGPVWVAFHHEPEGDGPPQDWKEMQQRLSPIMRAEPNIAFTVILTGWAQFFSDRPEEAMASYWPGAENVDVVGFDPYNWYGTTNQDGHKVYEWRELRDYYREIVKWLRASGNTSVRWAIAETGYTDVAADVAQADSAPDGSRVSSRGPGAEWLLRAFSDLKEMGGVALSYFAVPPELLGEPPDWTWPIKSEPKVSVFRRTMEMSSRWRSATRPSAD